MFVLVRSSSWLILAKELAGRNSNGYNYGFEPGFDNMSIEKSADIINNQSAGRCLRAVLMAVFLLIISLVLKAYASYSGAFAEWYRANVYSRIVSLITRVTGAVPFSVAELLLYVLILLFLISLVRLVCNIFHCSGAADVQDCPQNHPHHPPAPAYILSWFSNILLAAGVLFFIYTVCCGINYHSMTFAKKEGFVISDYGKEELEAVCILLTDNVNDLKDRVVRDDDGIMQTGGSPEDVAVTAMHGAAETYGSLAGRYPHPKKLIISEILSYQGLTGVYSPFTIEANYNGDMTPYNIPFTMCHELSHLRGFMDEKEANFIAFLACTMSEDESFRYSGYISAWVYCMNALYRTDQTDWQEIKDTLSDEVWADIEANNEFWAVHDGTARRTAERVNDTYLKSNGQADGVKGYDRIVDLIVTYYKSPAA